MAILNFLTAADEELQREFEQLATQVQFPRGHVLFYAGQPVRSVLLITSGYVTVSIPSEVGMDVLLSFRGPGEVLGIGSALTGELQSNTVKAISEVEGLDVPADAFLRFVQERHLEANIIRHLMERMREADQERTRLAHQSVGERFANLLVDLAAMTGRQGDSGVEIPLALSKAELASRIGASREAVNLQLRKLRDAGLILTGRRTMIVRDVEELRKLVTEAR
ncbi:Crp/Fnr family transcriptional regulator [Streptomyces sp. NPDC001351]|uniref:Crp/Fnr family transcriptional regulator n=1 Tax=Streptomyces sp. NPDC001351 TaxID=3364564 RepID=UPI003679AC8A